MLPVLILPCHSLHIELFCSLLQCSLSLQTSMQKFHASSACRTRDSTLIPSSSLSLSNLSSASFLAVCRSSSNLANRLCSFAKRLNLFCLAATSFASRRCPTSST
uniref:Uncharacterized protein n=1 Tax=Arundo donax TaxID=35708 RepID=A0A0A9D5R6_ARUDO